MGVRLWWVSVHYTHKYPLVVPLCILGVTSGFPTVHTYAQSLHCAVHAVQQLTTV